MASVYCDVFVWLLVCVSGYVLVYVDMRSRVRVLVFAAVTDLWRHIVLSARD